MANQIIHHKTYKHIDDGFTSDSNSTIGLNLTNDYVVLAVYTPNTSNIACIPYLHNNTWRARIINATNGEPLSVGPREFIIVYTYRYW